ncbi:hypothetical protein [Hydrogenophaga sp.]|uniref:hypothetical protein n=1 Tax=Hydrogenophaga sp. TaxID=1904254 RepID=UPI001ACE180B|nr:hypothetical protein [Hydrogenophaga sp.]MBN9373620.1 hypothetical protein [Hydrogenophaga sp.]
MVAWLAGDLAAADDVQLDLPQTGVCSTDLRETLLSGEVRATQGCCGGQAKTEAQACCVRDEVARTPKEGRCGCDAESDRRVLSRAATADASAVAELDRCCS